MGLWQIAFWDWKKSQRQRVREGSVLLTKQCWGRKWSSWVKPGQILGEQRVDLSIYGLYVHHWTVQIWTGSDPSCGWVKTVRLAQMTNWLVIWHNEWVLGLYAASLVLTNNVHSLCWFTDLIISCQWGAEPIETQKTSSFLRSWDVYNCLDTLMNISDDWQPFNALGSTGPR